MKKLLSIILLALCFPAFAVDRITVTVTITNTPANSNYFTLNGDTRTWKPSATNSASEITIGGSIGANATNLFNQVSANAFAGNIVPGRSGTNGITLTGNPGGAMGASISGTWGYITLNTQNVSSNFVVVHIPISGEPTASTRTNVASGLVDGISSYSTSKFPEAATALQNFVSTTTSQTVSNKTLTLGKFDNGDLTNATVKTVIVPYVTNAASGIQFRGPGGFLVSTISPDANGIPSLYATEHNPIPVLPFGSYLPNPENILTRDAGDTYYPRLTAANSFTGTNTMAQLTNTPIVGSTISSSTIGGTISTLSNGTIDGSTLTNVTAYGAARFTAGGGAGLTFTNSTTASQFTVSGDIALQRYDISTLANGNNANVNFGTNSYVRITAGPTAAFSVNGIANGRNGKFYWLYNGTSQQMTIANESGVDPTPANRIKTATGLDTVIGGKYWVPLIYDTSQSRWVLINQPFYSADLPSGINATNISSGLVSNADFDYIAGISSSGLPSAGLHNPTAQVGLTAVNGSATTALRSDGAPALDQSIAPTWTGQHNFRGSGTRVSVQYDASNKTDFETSSGGELIVTPSFSGSTFAGYVNGSSGFRVAGSATKGGIMSGNGTNIVQVAAGSNGQVPYADSTQAQGIRWGSLTNQVGTGTAGVYTRWNSSGNGIEDGLIIDGSNFLVPRTNNVTALGSTTNRFSTVNSVLGNFSSTISASQITSTVGSGTPPLVVSSVSQVNNLNSQYLNGKDGSYYWPCFATFGAGEMAYGAVTTGNPTRLLGNTSTTPKYLRMVGDGSSSAAPTWSQPAFSEFSGSVSSGQLPSGFSGLANPTASIGLSAVNGSATTAMRSDAAPALDVTVAPVWTGKHEFRKTTTPLRIAYDASHYSDFTMTSSGALRIAPTSNLYLDDSLLYYFEGGTAFYFMGEHTGDGSFQFGNLSSSGAGAGKFRLTSSSSVATTTIDFETGASTWTGAMTLNSSLSVGGGTAIAKILTATATLDFGNTAAQTSSDLTITVTGAAANDIAMVGPPASVNGNSNFTAWVSAADTVTVRFNNYSAAAIDPASATYRVTVMKY